MARELHELAGDLPRDGHEGRTVEEGVGHAGDEVRGARPQGGEADTRVAREAAVDVGHEGGALLVACGDKADARALEGKHQVEVLLARDAKDVLHALGLEAVNEDLRAGLGRRSGGVANGARLQGGRPT